MRKSGTTLDRTEAKDRSGHWWVLLMFANAGSDLRENMFGVSFCCQKEDISPYLALHCVF